jgi:hypothetical protein
MKNAYEDLAGKNSKETDHLGDLDMDEREMLKQILRKRGCMYAYVLDSSAPG